MPSSPLSPNCRPECRIPTHARRVLVVLFVTAITSIWCSETARLWQCLLSALALLEALWAHKQIRDFRTFFLQRDACGNYLQDDGSGSQVISGVYWQDFGYLAIQHYSLQGQTRTAVWWLVRMPERQLRQLRLWMNAPAMRNASELPSILVNPVL